MPLRATALADRLTSLFTDADLPATEAEAGRRWARLYREYAADAAAGPTTPVATSLGAAEAPLAGALAGAFAAAKAAGPGGIATLLEKVDAAFVAFWLTPVTFVTPPTGPPAIAGVVTVATPGGLASGLAGPLADGAGKGLAADQQARSLASVLDGWTRTVLVVNTPLTPPGPPAPPVPLS